ncbi:MAG: tetratricopeptide repeat protein [Myxococcales bacterium]|nr:tetratricopeptide repeat protein [Myxococcales bacterium]
MPALRKPHRVGVLLPDVTIEGDVALEPEAALLLWVALIECCQRHPMLAVYDPESTPLFPHEGHFAPAHASIGASPTDAFYGSTRRDELIWLELVARGVVRLHTLGRDGTKQSFDALGKNPGDQIHQVLSQWLSARGLGALPRRFEAVTTEELIQVVKLVAPLLVEQARAWATPVKHAPSEADLDAGFGDPDPTESGVAEEDPLAGTDSDAPEEVAEEDEPAAPAPPAEPPVRRAKVARPIANRLPPPLRLAALRLLALAIREELDDLILLADPEQPQALFEQYLASKGQGADFALLRRVIASAPCWARPYAELAVGDDDDDDEEGDAAIKPTELESVAGAGIAALCRPAQLDIIERVADLLNDSRVPDEGVRLLERAVATHPEDSSAHIALVEMVMETDREGALLAQAHASGRIHGCPMEPAYPWYPDQIQIDLLVATSLLRVGRLDEAIALRANRLEGREATWPRHTRILQNWRKDPRFVAWCYAREGFFRGDPARAVEGFGRIQPDDDVDLAVFLDALVAMGREDEVVLAWSQYGLGAGLDGPVARLAAARCLLAAGEWRRGLDELWRVSLTEPDRDEHVAIARCGLLLSCAPLEVAELALGEKVAVGANMLARRMARDVADFMPDAARSSVVSRALGKLGGTEAEPALGGFAAATRSKKAIDALFAAVGPSSKPDDALARADRLVNNWLEVVFAEASEDDPAALAQAACYAAAQALARYLNATTLPATPIAGALRTVAGEALALVREHRSALQDRDARALLGAVEPVLRRADRWIGSSWLGTLERSLALDERSGGDIAGFVREHATIAARVLGPEESAVLAASVARLHRERPANWAAAVNAQAMQLTLHTGYLGADEWADSVVALLAAREMDTDAAIDELLTCCYLVEGLSAGPSVHAARVLLEAGRGPAALGVLTAGLSAAGEDWRDRQLATLAEPWKRLKLDVPLAFEKLAAQMFDALQKGDPARAERLGRFSVAFDPGNGEAHRNLGLAYAQQGKVAEAMPHLVRGTHEQATQILSGVLYQAGKLPEAMAVLDYASRWYNRSDQWLTYGGIAYAAMDNPRTVKAYALAYQLDPGAFDESQLNAYAGVLDEVGDYKTCELIANKLIAKAGDDLMWKTNGWNHLACAYIGLGRFDEAVKLAQDAVAQNPLPDNIGNFATTLERAKTRQQHAPPPLPPIRQREPVFELLEAGDFASASALATDASWRVRRAALEATRFRFSSENDVDVTPRARASANAMLAATVGVTERDAVACRALALLIREQAYFARDPVPRMGDRMTREAFYTEFRARGGVVLGDEAPPPPPFKDRVVVPGGKLERVSDYVSLLRDLAALAPAEAIAQFDLDEAGYLDVAKAWAAAIEADASVAQAIAAGLAKR